MKRERILIIRIGALGDIILCFQAFHDIRCAHPDAEIAFLCMPVFAGFASAMPWFDDVIIDPRAPGWRLDEWAKLIASIRAFRPTRVYDLQGKTRQAIIYALLGGPLGPEWSGAAPGCSHPRFDPPQPGMHYTEFVRLQLDRANVPVQDAPDLSWLDAPLEAIALPSRYAVLVPGCAPHRDYKRWPAENFARVAEKLQARGISCVAVGTKSDATAIAALKRAASVPVEDISGRTSLLQLGAVLRRSTGVLSNDSGPMHMAAALGVPVLGLMSDRVDAPWSAPKGARAAWLQGKPLASLGADEVFLALARLLDKT